LSQLFSVFAEGEPQRVWPPLAPRHEQIREPLAAQAGL